MGERLRSVDCRFWEVDEDSLGVGRGRCHIRAPRVMEHGDTRFPVTDSRDWCGEWRDSKEAARG